MTDDDETRVRLAMLRALSALGLIQAPYCPRKFVREEAAALKTVVDDVFPKQAAAE